MEPSEKPSVPEAASAPIGSIDDTVARLALWCERARRGFARAEFDSEQARRIAAERLCTRLEQKAISFAEIHLPMLEEPTSWLSAFESRLQPIQDGVVSIVGFPSEFHEPKLLEAALRALNFRREVIAGPPERSVRQIWWMSPGLAVKLLQIAPDFSSWFIVRFRLTEVVAIPTRSPGHMEPIGADECMQRTGDGIDSALQASALQDNAVFRSSMTEETSQITTRTTEARQRANELAERMERALSHDEDPDVLGPSLALPAVQALEAAGLRHEAQVLSSRLAEQLDAARRRRPLSGAALRDLRSRLAELVPEVQDIKLLAVIRERPPVIRDRPLVIRR